MKTSRILSAISFGLIVTAPACSGKFATIGNESEDASAQAGSSGVGGSTGAVGGNTGAGGSTSITCLYNGANYPLNAQLSVACNNTCTCNSNGEMLCTRNACVDAGAGGSSGVGGSMSTGGSTGVTCLYNGVNYPVGSIPNQCGCTCTQSGTVACDNISCVNPSTGGSTGAGGTMSTGGSTSVTCLYNGVNYPPGTIPVNTCCTCGTDGSIGCANNTACNNQGTGGSSGVGGATGTSSCAAASDCTGALPQLCEKCADGSSGCAHFVCNSGSCEIAYCDNSSCIYNGVNYTAGSSFMASDGCNKCSCSTTGQVTCTTLPCPISGSGGASGVGGGSGQGGSTSCPAIPQVIPVCKVGFAILQSDPKTGCSTGYVCPTDCGSVPQVMPNCTGPNTAVMQYDMSTGCPTGYGCQNCPSFSTPSNCSNFQSVIDPTTGCTVSILCKSADASTCPAIFQVMPSCATGSAQLQYDTAGCATGYACP